MDSYEGVHILNILKIYKENCVDMQSREGQKDFEPPTRVAPGLMASKVFNPKENNHVTL